MVIQRYRRTKRFKSIMQKQYDEREMDEFISKKNMWDQIKFLL